MKEGEGEMVNKESRMRGGAVDLEGRVAAARRGGERVGRREGGEGRADGRNSLGRARSGCGGEDKW